MGTSLGVTEEYSSRKGIDDIAKPMPRFARKSRDSRSRGVIEAWRVSGPRGEKYYAVRTCSNESRPQSCRQNV